MSTFFTRERFGKPQFLAALLLLVFLGQCVWLASRAMRDANADPGEISRIARGLSLWHGGITGVTAARPPEVLPETKFEVRATGEPDPHHSRLYYLIASAPLLLWPGPFASNSRLSWLWLARVHFFCFGVLLGASLWYVARRLYGNAGGYVALTLYCFSPRMIRSSALWLAQPEVGAVWGAFGAVFTAIAVAHTLYAPREVVLWNWRRIVLLAVSLTLAIGSQFSLVILIPIVLAFLLYLAPTRRKAAVVIWAAACAIAFLLLFASYSFHPTALWQGLAHARFFGETWQALAMPSAYQQLSVQLGRICPALLIAFPAALIAYLAWPRARYFGNTAPLMMAVLFLILGLATPHYPGLGFRLVAVPFLFLFVSGIVADLLETPQQSLVLACISGLLAANAIFSLMELAQGRLRDHVGLHTKKSHTIQVDMVK
ncbi:MAG TPA: hypothetical protein VJX16_27250 [Terriglobales bacterium]|nr:hypothetical protein [Terriglobales bacterium]